MGALQRILELVERSSEIYLELIERSSENIYLELIERSSEIFELVERPACRAFAAVKTCEKRPWRRRQW
jgi:hypothetical protein